MANILNNVKEVFLSNVTRRNSFIAQLVIIFIIVCAYMQQSHRLQYYYNTLVGRAVLVSLFVLSCNYRYMFVTLALIACILFISFKTYEGFRFTDVDSISASVKSSMPASMMSLPPNPTPQNIYDFLNKQVCTSGNADVYSQIGKSPNSSDDAKLLAVNAFAINTAMCKSDGPFYQKPQALFDDYKKSCNTPGQNKKLIDLSTSITADPNSNNIFSPPLIAIAKWFSTIQSAICGAAAPAATPAATPAAPPAAS